MIDLHTHSTFSDGSLTPEELVAEGVNAGLKAMALTDHDCVDGVTRFLAACEASDAPEGIPGVEISANVDKGTMHILGYYMDYLDIKLENALRRIREGRSDRNVKILKALNDLNLELNWEEIASLAGEDVVGRPHFAMAMIQRGYVKSKDEAFRKYLAKGKPGYVDRFRLSPKEALKAIREAGGMPALAHPFTLELSARELKGIAGELKSLGLMGIEVYYSEHSPELIGQYKRLADEFGLVAVGGTDFHGQLNPGVRVGRGFGGLEVPDRVIDEMKEALDRTK